MDRWSRQQSVTAYWGIGRHWGSLLSNNARGDLVGHIKVGGWVAGWPCSVESSRILE